MRNARPLFHYRCQMKGNAPSQESLANIPSICGFPWKCIYDPLPNICHHEHNLLKVFLLSSSLSIFLTPGLCHDVFDPYHHRWMEDRRDVCLHTSSANTGSTTASSCGERTAPARRDRLFVAFCLVLSWSLTAQEEHLHLSPAVLSIAVLALIDMQMLTLSQNL